MKKRRNKKYRPRPIRAPALIGVHNIWAAPLKLLHDIRHGEVWTVNNQVVMPAMDERDCYSAPDVFRMFAHFIGEVAQLHGREINTTPLLTLANRLDADMPIDDGALLPVEQIFDLGRRMANHITPDQALEILAGCGNKQGTQHGTENQPSASDGA